MLTIARLHAQQILNGPRKWLLVAALCTPILLAVVVRTTARISDPDLIEFVYAAVLFFLYAIGVTGLSGLLFGTSILGAEIQRKTLTYLFTRPVSRARIVTEKFLANASVLTLGTLLSATVGWLILGAGSVRVLAGLAVAIVLATFGYNAVFSLIGSLVTRRPMLFGALFLGYEIMLASVPAVVREFTIMYYVRCAAIRVSGFDAKLPEAVRPLIGDASLVTSVSVVAGICVLAVVAMASMTERREFALTDDPG